jgi:hypothetical protein
MTTEIPDVEAILLLHKRSIIEWTFSKVELKEIGFLKIVEENHAFNYRLWHAEDRARRDDLGHEFVYLAKREIDKYNQQRNDRMELIDEFMIRALSPSVAHTCAIHSETPGMMIDRLSILSLKAYYMTHQSERETASDKHRELCKQKLELLCLQRDRLALNLNEFIQEILNQTRTFYTYRQFKMYNDKNLNPQLY